MDTRKAQHHTFESFVDRVYNESIDYDNYSVNCINYNNNLDCNGITNINNISDINPINLSDTVFNYKSKFIDRIYNDDSIVHCDKIFQINNKISNFIDNIDNNNNNLSNDKNTIDNSHSDHLHPHSHYCNHCNHCKFYDFDELQFHHDKLQSISQCNDDNCNCIHHINTVSKYTGTQYPEQTTNTKHFSSKWSVRVWTAHKQELYLFADTGASVSACNEEYARKYFPNRIKSLKSYIPVRVANGEIVKLKDYLLLPIHDQEGKHRLDEMFYLIPGLKHPLLASFYVLQKLELRFPRDAPLLTKNLTLHKTKYNHPEEDDETFGDCNNWDSSRLVTRIHQQDYLNDPNFKPYANKYQHLNEIEFATKNHNDLFEIDFQEYDARSVVTDPYHNKIKSYNPQNYSTFYGIDMNTIQSVKFQDTKYQLPYQSVTEQLLRHDVVRPLIPTAYFKVTDKLLHISNYKATTEELKRAQQLVDARNFNKVPLEHVKEISYQLYNKMTKLLYNTLDDLFAKNQYSTRILPKYEFKIDLTDDAPPRIFIAQYPLSPDKRLVIINTAIQNKKSGIFIYNDSSPHNVPIIIIQKKTKSTKKRLRAAYALQHLNKFTKTVKSYIPTYAYLFENLRGKGKFSTTDAKNFFECILLRLQDQLLAHVTTPIGPFNLTRATYGFKNIMALAQDITNYLVRPFEKTVAFVDDIIKKHAPNATPDELYQDIYELFTRAYEIGLLFNPEKTYLFADEVEYLGYIFNQIGVIPRPEYIQKVLQFLPPNSKKEIQQYLAVLNYIARFLPKLAHYASIINRLTHKDKAFHWGKEQQEAFEHIQQLLQRTPLLAHPTDDGEYLVQTDASKYAMAAVLYQRQLNENNEYEWKIIEFYSKQFDKHLIDHPIMIKECLAITYALNHWQHFLLRKKFFVDTDHRNLISLYDSDEMKATNMKKKQMFVTMRNAIAQFNFQIAHLKGEQIPLPDYLTRDGSTAYRTAPAVLTRPQFKKPKFSDKEEENLLYLTLDYMRTIRMDEIDFPPSLQEYCLYSASTFNHQCIHNQINLIDQFDPLKSQLLEDRLQYHKHEPYLEKNELYQLHYDHQINSINPELNLTPITYNNPLHRWLRAESNAATQIPDKINSIHTFEEMPNYYSIPNSIHMVTSMDEINSLRAEPNQKTKTKPKKKSVSFNLTPQTTKETKHVSRKSILKNTPGIDYNAKDIIARQDKKIYMYEMNKRAFDHCLYDTLEMAFVNRFYNQAQEQKHIQLSSDDAADLYSLILEDYQYNEHDKTHHQQYLNLLTIEAEETQKHQPNYFVDKQGRRRSQRKRKIPKKFYEAFEHEHSETVKAKDYPDSPYPDEKDQPTNKIQHRHLTKKQKARKKKEKKYELTPTQTHELYKSLFDDVYRADEIDQLLSPTKLLLNQQNDPICKIIIDHIENPLPLSNSRYDTIKLHYRKLFHYIQHDQFYINENNLVCLKANPNDTDNPSHTDRLYIPTNLIRIALKYIHKASHFSHPGIKQTQQLVKQKFYWYKWQSDSKKFVQQCPECQQAKGHKFHKRGKLAPLISHRFNDIVHCDFLGPLHKDLHILVMVDNLTGYTMLVPTLGQTATDIVQAILLNWKPINGLPRRILTDRGKGFISELNQRVYSILGIKGLFTSGYHPQTNAKAERRVKEAKKAIRMLNTTLNGELTDKRNQVQAIQAIKLLLPSIQFSLNQKPFAFSGISPHMLTRGSNLNDVIDVTAALSKLKPLMTKRKYQESHQILENLRKELTIVRKIFNNHRWYYVSEMLRKFNKDKNDETFKPGDQVMYYVGERSYPMKTIRPRFTGPFTITKRINHNTVTIFNKDDGKSITCHTQKLKLYHENKFTEEQDFIRQLKQKQKINKEYRRKRGVQLQRLLNILRE